MDSLPHRLSALSSLATNQPIPIPPKNALLINTCLATLESLLQPPQTQSQPAPDTNTDTDTNDPDLPHGSNISHSILHSHIQLKSLLGDISSLAHELDNRRAESARVYAAFTSRCVFLEDVVRERDGEVGELRDDILDDAVEMEGVQGTVAGLESWVRNWDVAVQKQDGDLLDGITAWIRGWKDIQDVFCARQLQRRRRREERDASRRATPIVMNTTNLPIN